MKNQAQRRHYAKLALRKAVRIATYWSSPSSLDGSRDHVWIHRIARLIRDNRKPCSCQMCRNPRHSVLFKTAAQLSIQERRANLSRDETD